MANGKIPSGSVSVLASGSTEPKTEEPVETAVEEPKAEPTPNPLEEKISKLEKELENSQKLIGKHSDEVKTARGMKQELEELKARLPQEPKGPTVEEQIDEISAKMEDGDIGLREGNRLIAQLSAQLGKDQAMTEYESRRQQEESGKLQQQFMEKNPDYQDVLQSGALEPYLKADPLNDEFSAYKEFKADQRIKELEEQYRSDLAAAKEEGAKLASGAENAGKVAGKTGTTLRPTGEIKKFNNSREATDAMQAELQRIRSASG